jgi:hypothetical protein
MASPSHADDPQSMQAFAFGYGYIKALIQAVAGEGAPTPAAENKESP